jgi:hypothetical protein
MVINFQSNDLDSLIAALQTARQEAGKNLPLNLSVLQEHEHQHVYEDRSFASHIEIVNGKFVELYA